MRLYITLCYIIFGLIFVATNLAHANENAADIEKRAHLLAQQIRCMVCQGQSIDDSDADLAKDMNKILREKIAAGWKDEQILNFLHERYGDFILMKPPFAAHTFLLWLGPALLLGGGALLIYRYWRSKT